MVNTVVKSKPALERVIKFFNEGRIGALHLVSDGNNLYPFTYHGKEVCCGVGAALAPSVRGAKGDSCGISDSFANYGLTTEDKAFYKELDHLQKLHDEALTGAEYERGHYYSGWRSWKTHETVSENAKIEQRNHRKLMKKTYDYVQKLATKYGCVNKLLPFKVIYDEHTIPLWNRIQREIDREFKKVAA